MTPFSYAEFTTRNRGFVSAEEQERLRRACVFVCGAGGMGGAALMALARAGVGRLIVADLDAFEISNLNRQVFCFTDTVGQAKQEAATEGVRRINPGIDIETLDGAWTRSVERLVGAADVVVNGTDDLGASLLLYRTGRALKRPVVDAYASPLPSVYVTRPGEATPEERLGYPTAGKAWDAIDKADRAAAFQAEILHVLVHSSSRRHIDLAIAAEVAAGRRSRMSFAPMVISTGMLMAYEALALVLGKRTGTDNRGWFLNPYAPAIEKPRSAPVAAVMRPLVRRFLDRMMAAP